MSKSFLLVGLGGAVGAMLRYAVGLLVARRMTDPTAFPVATLIVNWVGGLAIGLLAAALPDDTDAARRLRLLAIAGLLGGFTTFSAYSLETVALIERRRPAAAAAYVLLSNVGSVALAYAGLRLGRSAVT